MDDTPWYELLDQLIGREGLSRPQVARRAGVKTKSITSWLRGDVKSPRQWQPLARVLRALHASPREANRILRGAGFHPVAHLAAHASGDERELLAAWLQPGVSFMAPDRPVATLIGRTAELERAAAMLSRHRRCVLVGMGKTTLAI